MSWCIPGYSPAYSRVFAGSVNGVVVGLLVSLRVLAYPVAFWRILAESFEFLRKFVGLYGSQPHPRNRASRFYVITGFWSISALLLGVFSDQKVHRFSNRFLLDF